MPEYPEHDKLHALQGNNQTVGDFIEWLNEHGYWICTRNEDFICYCDHKAEEHKHGGSIFRTSPCEAEGCECDDYAQAVSPGWYPINDSTEKLLGRYFEIDPQKLAEEKDQMLEEIRAAANRPPQVLS